MADYEKVAAHTELMWILSGVASMGLLSRMTQWKVCISVLELLLISYLTSSQEQTLPPRLHQARRRSSPSKAQARPILLPRPPSSRHPSPQVTLSLSPTNPTSILTTPSRANLVPVGSDQQQHIEFARSLATSFNHHYNSPIFPLPTALICPFPLPRAPIIPTNNPSSIQLPPKE